MATQNKKTTGSPPYQSISTFITFLDWVRDMKVMPSYIDRSLWSTKFGGSVGTQLMTGLRFMGLIDDEQSTPKLEQLARVDNEQRKSLLRELLLEVYGDVVIQELENGTPKRLNDALSALGTTSHTHDKARSFLINAAKLAELTVLPAIGKQARNRKSSPRRRSQNGESGSADEPPKHDREDTGETPGPSSAQSVETVALPSGATVTLSMNVNPIALSPQEREWLFTIIDAFKNVEQLSTPSDYDSNGLADVSD